MRTKCLFTNVGRIGIAASECDAGVTDELSPEAHTEWEPEQTETKASQEIVEGSFSQIELGSQKLGNLCEGGVVTAMLF